MLANYSEPTHPRDSQNRKNSHQISKHYDIFLPRKGPKWQVSKAVSLRLCARGQEVRGGAVNSTFKLLPPPHKSEKSKTSQPLTSNWWQMFVTPSTPLPALNTQTTTAKSVSGPGYGMFFCVASRNQ